jgi:hypothetical protein
MKRQMIDVEVISSHGCGRGTCEAITFNKFDALCFAGIPVVFSAGILAFIFSMSVNASMLGAAEGAMIGAMIGALWGFKAFKKFNKRIKIRNGQAECLKCLKAVSFGFTNGREPLNALCPRCATHYSVKLSKDLSRREVG